MPHYDAPVKKARKRKTPTEKIETIKDPWRESMWMKLAGKNNFYHISKKDIRDEEDVFYGEKKENGRKKDMVYEDKKKTIKILKNKKHDAPYMELHTHPDASPYLSGNDIKRLLHQSYRIKTMVTAQTNSETGEVEGYAFYKRTKSTPSYSEVKDKITVRDSDGHATADSLKGALKKYGIKSRMVPAEGYRFDEDTGVFLKRDGGLISKLAASVLVCFVAGLALFSPNITGNAIGNLASVTSNGIGGILIVAGLVGAFVAVKKKID